MWFCTLNPKPQHSEPRAEQGLHARPHACMHALMCTGNALKVKCLPQHLARGVARFQKTQHTLHPSASIAADLVIMLAGRVHLRS